MPHSNNYTPLANLGNVYLVESHQPEGIYLANSNEDGSMDLVERVEYVERMLKDLDHLRQKIEMLQDKPNLAPTGKTDRSTANKALAAALRARGKDRIKGAPSWPEWDRAKALLASGLSIEDAADQA
jgi:hypothetical protein